VSPIAIISGYSPSFERVGRISTENHKAYAESHGYRYICAPFPDGQGSWPKVDILAKAFEDSTITTALWIDADAIFTNFDLTITEHLPSPGRGIVWAPDINGPNAGVMWMANSMLVRQLLWAVRTSGRHLFGMMGWHDQSAFRFFSREEPYRTLFKTVRQETMNSYRNDLYQDGRPQDFGQWKPGDFILHLPGISNDVRERVFKENAKGEMRNAESPIKLTPKREKIVISNFEGLGDLLLLSTLAERFTKERDADVYISAMDKPPRNKEVLDLILSNPFLKGFSSEPANAGMIHARKIGEQALMGFPNPIRTVEKVHGFEAPFNSYPKLYVEPKLILPLVSSIIFDLTAFTVEFTESQVEEYIERIIRPRYGMYPWLQIKHRPGISGPHAFKVRGTDSIEIGSLQEMIDAIGSCRAFVGLESGGHALACAIRGNKPTPAVHCLMSTRTHNGRVFVYPNAEHTVVSTGDDYWMPCWP
jgi:hypothetical protein